MTTIRFVKGDITKVSDVDAIVNAANKSLLGGGGVDGAIHRAAGPQLKRECETLHGCETGQAKITNAYKLPCHYVIHTVGPVWNGGARGEDGLLAACYRNCLAVARENGIRRIAFPSISTGIYHFPLDRAARIAKETVQRVVEERPDAFDLIEWVLYDDEAFLAYNPQGQARVSERLQNAQSLKSGVDALDALYRRRSIRSFTGVPADARLFEEILRAGQAAPVARGNYQDMHISVIRNKELLAEISANGSASVGNPDMDMLYGAPALILVSTRKPRSERVNAVCSSAACIVQNMAIAATALDVGACHIWGAIAALAENESLVEKLNLPEGFVPLCGLAVGETRDAYCTRSIDMERIATSYLY